MDFKVIPSVFTTVDKEFTVMPRDIASMAQFLEWSYQLFEHPVFKKWGGFQAVDAFNRNMSPEEFVRFNRTLIERTIGQARQCSRTPLFDEKSLAISGKGIEMNISLLHTIWNELSKLFELDSNNISSLKTSIEFKRLHLQVELIGVVKFFVFSCNEMIFLHMKHHVQVELQKISSNSEKTAYLLESKKVFLLQKDQLWVSVFTQLNDYLEIELAYLRAMKEQEITDDTHKLIRKLLEEDTSRISSGKLLGYLLTDQVDRFCEDLKEFTVRVLSSHDIGGKDPEKVYHSFLVGIFSAFAHHYEISSNREAGLGRFDICLRPYIPGNKGVIFEVKRSISNKPKAFDPMLDLALEQVKIKKYGYELKDKGAKDFIAIAVVFYSKELLFKHTTLPIP